MIALDLREEKLLKDLPAEERMIRRQLSVKPLVEAYFIWVRENLPKGFCCFRNTVDDCTGLGSGNCIDHDPVLLADAESTDRLLGGVVVHWDFSVIKKHLQVFFLIQGIIGYASQTATRSITRSKRNGKI